VWTIARFCVVALVNASSDGPEASGSTASRMRPEPRPRTSIATPQRLLSALTPAFEAFFRAAQEELVDLDLAPQRLALGGDHRRHELVHHRPRGLVSTDAELALKLLGADPGPERRDQIGRPEPRPQRQPGLVHDRARRDH